GRGRRPGRALGRDRPERDRADRGGVGRTGGDRRAAERVAGQRAVLPGRRGQDRLRPGALAQLPGGAPARGGPGVKIAIHVHTHGVYSDARLVADLAREAEAAGWDGVFVSDHLVQQLHGAPSPVADPWITLTAVALATQRVLI